MIALDESSLFEKLVAGLFAIIGLGFSWIMNGMNKNIQKNTIKIEENAREFAQYQLYVERNHPNQETMKRFYAALEDMGKDITAIKVMIAGRKSH